jgi:hypothetical protein
VRIAVALGVALSAAGAAAQAASRPARARVDDDDLIDKITLACEALRTNGQLEELAKLRQGPAARV